MVCVHRVVEQLGGKQLVMTHLSHEDPNVRYEALLAVQKLMVHNWYVTLIVHLMNVTWSCATEGSLSVCTQTAPINPVFSLV